MPESIKFLIEAVEQYIEHWEIFLPFTLFMFCVLYVGDKLSKKIKLDLTDEEKREMRRIGSWRFWL